jgi:diacylglycerol kinase (ATP)
MLGQDYHFINRRLSVKIDGKEAAIPDESQGVILININSFAGGSRLWQSNGEHREQNHDDEAVEVVSVDGPMHLGQIKTGISHGQNLGQCKRFEVRFFQKTHVQFDGEPEMLPPCRATVAHAGQALMLCNCDHVPRVKHLEEDPTDPAIDFDEVVVSVLKEAQRSGTIDARQARALKKSFGVHLKQHQQS